MESPPTPTRARRGDSEARLLDAGLKLATEGGYDHVTILAVADLAGVSRVTAYKYFRNKDHLLSALAITWNEQALAALELADIQDDNLGRLAARRLGFLVRHLRKHPRLLAAILSAMASPEGQGIGRDTKVIGQYLGIDLSRYGPTHEAMLSRIFGYTLQAMLVSANAERIEASVVQQDLEFLCQRLLRQD